MPSATMEFQVHDPWEEDLDPETEFKHCERRMAELLPEWKNRLDTVFDEAKAAAFQSKELLSRCSPCHPGRRASSKTVKTKAKATRLTDKAPTAATGPAAAAAISTPSPAATTSQCQPVKGRRPAAPAFSRAVNYRATPQRSPGTKGPTQSPKRRRDSKANSPLSALAIRARIRPKATIMSRGQQSRPDPAEPGGHAVLAPPRFCCILLGGGYNPDID